MGGSKKVTVGYRYYLGMHMVMSHGPVDALLRIRVDNKIAWEGNVSGQEDFLVNAPGLFGGESREGGVQGIVGFMDGAADQVADDYLVAQLGDLVPAFRGVAGVVLKQTYVGINPYLKRWGFRLQRIHVRQNGVTQWYDEKAETGGLDDNETLDQEWEWIQSGADVFTIPPDPNAWPEPDSGWQEAAPQPFGVIKTSQAPPYSDVAIRSLWQSRTSLWLRRYVVLSQDETDLKINVLVENSCWVYWDAQYVGAINSSNGQPGTNPGDWVEFDIPANRQDRGGHTLTLYCLDESSTSFATSNTYVAAYVSGASGTGDMNPAHIVRECLTDPDWGMGYLDGDIDDTSFTYAANTLWTENMGMSLLWDRQIPIQDFIQEVLKHINAALYVDRRTGKFTLKLIRDDYDPDDLIELDEDSVDKVENVNRPQFGELTTSITVEFWDSANNVKGSVTIQDIALEQMQQAAINTTLQYPGFTTQVLAQRVAERELRTLSAQLASCTVYTDRTAADLQVGDVFKLTWPDHEFNASVMRVTGIAYGDGKMNRIRLTAIEDSFSLPAAPSIDSPPGEWVDPSEPPVAVDDHISFEAPYLESVQQRGQTDTDTLLSTNPALGYVMCAAKRSTASSLNARVYTDSGSGYGDVGTLDYCPTVVLAENIDRMDTEFAISGANSILELTLGTWIQFGTELMAIVAIDSDSIEVERGVLDTVPVLHVAGEVGYAWDSFSGSDPTEYVDGESINVKIAPVSGSGEVPLADIADPDTVVMAGRMARPYPPGNVKVNGEYFPEFAEGDVVLTWTHRDRTQQTGGSLVGFPEASIGPEVGTTYTVEVYDEDNTLQHTQSAISGVTYTYTQAQEVADGGAFGELRLRVFSVRDTLESYQAHEFTLLRTLRVTELGDARTTETSENRVDE